MLAIGTPAPDFTLPDARGETVALRECLAQGPVVIYFYPAAFTPICTKEACMFRDVHEELAPLGVRVLAINAQSPAMLARFQETFRLPFTLLSDQSKSVIRAYEASGLFGFSVKRLSYFVGTDGVIADALHSEWSVAKHNAFVQRVIAACAGRARAQ